MARLQDAFSFTVKLAPSVDVGPVPTGVRRIIPIVGGSFEGDRLRGAIMAVCAAISILSQRGLLCEMLPPSQQDPVLPIVWEVTRRPNAPVNYAMEGNNVTTNGIETSGRSLSEHEARNRDVILDYYGKIIGKWDYDAASEHLGDHFIQHNPTIGDGLAGLEAFVRGCPPPVRETLTYKIARMMVDGDFVMLHMIMSVPGMPDNALIDVFRLESHKVVEHWDIMQPVPETAVHGNAMV